MGRLPAPAREMTQTLPSVAEMESRAQKPARPQVSVSVTEIPVMPAGAAKVPTPTPEVNVEQPKQEY